MTWQYIAGFFDGEGSLVHNKVGFRITISQTNEEVLKRIQNFSGVGIVFKEKKRKPHWQDSWVYYIAKQEDIYNFLISVNPYLVVKKQKISKAVPKLKIIVRDHKKKKRAIETRIKKAKQLRGEGLTYRQIGKELNMDFGHVRRLVLKDGGRSSIG